MIKAGKILVKSGVKNVLIKGGHGRFNYIEDVLIGKKNLKIFKRKKIATKNTHGTGCTLSSSIASFLAKNYSIEEAVSKSKEFVTGAIRDSKKLSVGNGHGPTNHFHALKFF